MAVSNKKHRGKVRPIKSMLVSAMSSLRRQNSKASTNSNQADKFVLGASELVKLGQLIHHWKEIVGPEFSTKVWPERLFQSKLTLIVKNHQWLNTLTFCKAGILTNITNFLPNLKVVKIIGRVGTIPAVSKLKMIDDEVSWPDWQLEDDIDLPMLSDADLLETVQRCRKKLNARVKGLKESGLYMCPTCSGNMVSASNKSCAVCLYKKRIKELTTLRNTMSKEPWTTYTEAKKVDDKLTAIEFESMKSSLLIDAMQFVEQLGRQQSDLIEQKNPELEAEMRTEMVRAIVLATGVTPDTIDFDDLDKKCILSDSWYKFLRIEKDKGDATC